MKPARIPSTRRPLGLSPIVFGVACCIVSAFAYTAVNICLRFMSTQFDQVWVVCMKELMTVVIIAPWLLAQAYRGRMVLPSTRLLVVLTVMGLLIQWAGNLPMIWAMSVVGLSITVPVALGTNLAFSAILGWLILRERITGASAFAIALMFLSVVLFSLGASRVSESITGTSVSTTMTILAVLAAVMAGTVFACLAIVIRRSVTGSTSPSMVVFMITFVGVITLGPWSLYQNGLEMLYEIPIRDHILMIVMGTLNLVGFISVAKGLEMTTVAHVNVITASQVAMGVVAGMMLFGEPASSWLILGVCLAIAGIIIIRPAHEEEMEVSTGV
ncbi:MAG: DMT family transporter [Planctomycetota bacterium]|nr:DMT family transporter [Planctomycetota bacterium]